MDNERGEPGILDLLSSLFEEDGPGAYRCDKCQNAKAVIMVLCPCGWKFQGCLACLLIDTSKNAHAMADAFKEHKVTCEELQRLVRIAEAAQ